MGCAHSNQRVAVAHDGVLSHDTTKESAPTMISTPPSKMPVTVTVPYNKKVVNGKSSLIRLDHISEPKRLPAVSGKTHSLVMQYIYVCQRGYYPTALGKANQDSYLVCESLLGDSSCNFFGIFDGHGEAGDLCSHFIADHISETLVQEIAANGGLSCLDGANMTDIVSRAHILTNEALERSNVDDSLSGTTSITIIQKGDKLIVSNVGDSRAIIASEREGKLQFSPLSADQTPYRKDERERLKKCGATIMTMDQIEGNEPMHENYCTDLGQEIDEVTIFSPALHCCR